MDGNATLTGAPVIESGTADLYISDVRGTTDFPVVDATGYIGTDVLTLQEKKFPDAHQGRYTGYAIKVNESDKGKFQLTNGGDFVYDYNDGALRLYNSTRYAVRRAAAEMHPTATQHGRSGHPPAMGL